ncbi:MAG: hypothetical protein ABIS01_12355 [Ferruginibacter sp.]
MTIIFPSTNFKEYAYEQVTIGLLFLLAAIGIPGFPIKAAFIEIDV